MDLIQIANKINEFEQEFGNFKEKATSKLDLLEKKLSISLQNNFEVKSVDFENRTNIESEDFVNYIRTGEIQTQNVMEFKAQNGSFDAGIPVSVNSGNLISYHLSKLSVMRKLCRVQVISTDSFDVLIEKDGGKATWGTPKTTDPAKKNIRTFELVAEPKATIKLIEDVRTDIEQFMSEEIAKSFALAEDDAFLNGDGTNNPQGLLNIKDINSSKLDLTTESLFSMVDTINSSYSGNLSFLMTKKTEMQIKALKDNNDRHIWQGKILEGENNTIFGIPVFNSNFMPDDKIILGNFDKGYKIVEKFGNYVMRDPYTQRPFIKFYTSKKIGGDVVDADAFHILVINQSTKTQISKNSK